MYRACDRWDFISTNISQGKVAKASGAAGCLTIRYCTVRVDVLLTVAVAVTNHIAWASTRPAELIAVLFTSTRTGPRTKT